MAKFFITRKIQLKVDSKDYEFIKEVYSTLHRWSAICRKAANLISTHHFFQEQVKDLIYFTEETKVKLVDIKKDENGILSTSKMNTSYQVMVQHFKGEIPMHILSSLNNTVVSYLNKETFNYLTGEKSLRNYKKNLPVPFKGTDLKFTDTSYEGTVFHFTLFKIPFKTYLGKDYFDKRKLLKECFAGERKIRTSSIKIEDGKIYLLAVFEFEKEILPLDKDIIAEVRMGMEVPMNVIIGNNKYNIGNKEEFLYRRLAIQASLNRKREAAKFCRSKNGKKRQWKLMDDLKSKEKNYVHSKQHLYSKMLIDICIKHGAGTIILGMDKIEEDDENSAFLLRNWSYYGLSEKIKYKATLAGIQLVVE